MSMLSSESDVAPSHRGQSTVVGAILMIGLIMASSTIMVGLMAVTLDSAQQNTEQQAAEMRMSALTDGLNDVAQGRVGQKVSVPGFTSTPTSLSDTGQITITVSNESSGNSMTVVNTTVGTFTYETADGSVVGYQAGGVWKKTSSGKAVTVSTPPLSIEGSSVTFPITRFVNSSSPGQTATYELEKTGEQQHYPLPDAEQDGGEDRNPLRQQEVNITIQSQFYRAWGAYLNQEGATNIRYNASTQTVRATLIPAGAADGSRSMPVKQVSTEPQKWYGPVYLTSKEHTLSNGLYSNHQDDCDTLSESMCGAGYQYVAIVDSAWYNSSTGNWDEYECEEDPSHETHDDNEWYTRSSVLFEYGPTPCGDLHAGGSVTLGTGSFVYGNISAGGGTACSGCKEWEGDLGNDGWRDMSPQFPTNYDPINRYISDVADTVQENNNNDDVNAIVSNRFTANTTLPSGRYYITDGDWENRDLTLDVSNGDVLIVVADSTLDVGQINVTGTSSGNKVHIFMAGSTFRVDGGDSYIHQKERTKYGPATTIYGPSQMDITVKAVKESLFREFDAHIFAPSKPNVDGIEAYDNNDDDNGTQVLISGTDVMSDDAYFFLTVYGNLVASGSDPKITFHAEVHGWRESYRTQAVPVEMNFSSSAKDDSSGPPVNGYLHVSTHNVTVES